MRSTLAMLAVLLGLTACSVPSEPIGTAPQEEPVVRATSPAATASDPAAEPAKDQLDVSLHVTGLPNNRVRVEGTVIGAKAASFRLNVEAARSESDSESEFVRETTVTIAEDGSFRSEALELAEGSESEVYRVTLFVPTEPRSMSYGAGSGEGVQMFSPLQMIHPEKVNEVPEGILAFELSFGVGGQSTEAERAAWRDAQLASYRQWQTNLEDLKVRLDEQFENPASAAQWQARSEQIDAGLLAYRQQFAELGSLVEHRAIGGALDGLDLMLAEVERLTIERQQNPRNPLLRLFPQLFSGALDTNGYIEAKNTYINATNDIEGNLIRPLEFDR